MEEGARQAHKGVLGRLCWYILSAGGTRVSYTRQAVLASFLGTSERHLSRELRHLEDLGAIKTAMREIRVLDRQTVEGAFEGAL